MRIKLLIISSFLILLSSCNNYRFVVKKHNEFVINLKKEGTQVYVPNYLIYKKYKKDYVMDKEMKKLIKMNKLIPNENYDSILFLFVIDYKYLESMKNYVLKKRCKKNLINLTAIEFYEYKAYFDSIRMANPVLPVQKLNW